MDFMCTKALASPIAVESAAPSSFSRQVARLALAAICAFTLAACGTRFEVAQPTLLGDPKNASDFGYTPLDPIPTNIVAAPTGKKVLNSDILEPMADEVMRIAIGTFSVDGKLTFGPVGVSGANSRYIVILDYGKTVTRSIPFKRTVEPTTKVVTMTLIENPLTDQEKATTDVTYVPVYVGVGLRLTAEIVTLKAGIDISTLVSIGANASDIKGTLSVQTLGISGENVSTAIPFPADISVSSVQAAIQSLGTIKAKMYDSKTSIHPRMIGFYNTVGGGRDTTNGLISSALKSPLRFDVTATGQ